MPATRDIADRSRLWKEGDAPRFGNGIQILDDTLHSTFRRDAAWKRLRDRGPCLAGPHASVSLISVLGGAWRDHVRSPPAASRLNLDASEASRNLADIPSPEPDE